MTIITRKDYMNADKSAPDGTYDRAKGMAAHRAYHAQFCQFVSDTAIPKDLLARCRTALAEGDHHFNSPYTRLEEWDRLDYLTKGPRMTTFRKEVGEGWSLSFNTCVLKEKARQLIERDQGK